MSSFGVGNGIVIFCFSAVHVALPSQAHSCILQFDGNDNDRGLLCSPAPDRHRIMEMIGSSSLGVVIRCTLPVAHPSKNDFPRSQFSRRDYFLMCPAEVSVEIEKYARLKIWLVWFPTKYCPKFLFHATDQCRFRMQDLVAFCIDFL